MADENEVKEPVQEQQQEQSTEQKPTEPPPAETQVADAIRYHFDEKGTDEVDDEGDEDLQLEHGQMVALLGSYWFVQRVLF